MYRFLYFSRSRVIKKTLESKFGLIITIQKRKTSGGIQGYRLYISSKSREILIPLVESYFITSMKYKLGLV